ncbi:MAG: GAF domain-containing protein, partial [Verrucomicrobiales bacterium]
ACSAGRGLMEVLTASPLVFLAMPVVGLLSGELHRQSAGRREQLERENSELGRANNVFEKDLELSRESQHVLQKELSLMGADVCSLDLELRKIFESGAPPVLQGTLKALAEISGLSDAAFYLLDDGGETLQRAEFVGDGAYFPDEIGSRHTKMAWLAIESGELVSCRGLGDGQGEIGNARFLAAVPWKRGGKVAGVLLVYDMPFLSMNWQTLARIELVCDWVAMMEELRAPGGVTAGVGVGETEKFKDLLGIAGQSFDAQGLASSVVLLSAVGALAGGGIRESIASALRPTDVTIEIENGRLAVLLPLEAGRDAGVAAARLVEAAGREGTELEMELLHVGENLEPQALWEELESAGRRG